MIAELRKQFPMLQGLESESTLRYFDNAATTFMPACGLDAMDHFERNSRANIERGMYDLGIEATEIYARAREQVASYVGARGVEEINFNSGTTMGINQLAYGIEPLLQKGDEIVISLAEHHSNFVPWQMLSQRQGLKIRFIPVDERGCLDLTSLSELITHRCKVVAITLISNVTGEQVDIDTIVQAAQKVGAKVFVDGAQAVAHGPLKVATLGVDAFAFSGHKCFGPTGVGALWLSTKIQQELRPMLTGGSMVQRVGLETTSFVRDQRRNEAGTPPITQVVALGVVMDWLANLPWDEIERHERILSSKLLSGLRLIPGLRLLGPEDSSKRSPIFSFALAGAHPHDIAHILNDFGVAVRGGHHCAQPLLEALGLNATTRISCAFYNTEEDIDVLFKSLDKARELLL